jgi:hypothetical protein
LQFAVNTTNGAGGQVSPSNSMAPVREFLCNFSFSVKTRTMQAKMSDAWKLARSIRKRHHEQAIPNSGSPESSVGTVPESILSNSATSAVSRGNERKAKMWANQVTLVIVANVSNNMDAYWVTSLGQIQLESCRSAFVYEEIGALMMR